MKKKKTLVIVKEINFFGQIIFTFILFILIAVVGGFIAQKVIEFFHIL